MDRASDDIVARVLAGLVAEKRLGDVLSMARTCGRIRRIAFGPGLASRTVWRGFASECVAWVQSTNIAVPAASVPIEAAEFHHSMGGYCRQGLVRFLAESRPELSSLSFECDRDVREYASSVELAAARCPNLTTLLARCPVLCRPRIMHAWDDDDDPDGDEGVTAPRPLGGAIGALRNLSVLALVRMNGFDLAPPPDSLPLLRELDLAKSTSSNSAAYAWELGRFAAAARNVKVLALDMFGWNALPSFAHLEEIYVSNCWTYSGQLLSILPRDGLDTGVPTLEVMFVDIDRWPLSQARYALDVARIVAASSMSASFPDKKRDGDYDMLEFARQAAGRTYAGTSIKNRTML